MPELSPEEQLNIARGRLERVQVAWYDPVDWADLSNYGLYALEAGVMAAARETGLAVKATHWAKAAAAGELAEAHDLDDVSDLMARLNEARKAANYGDMEAPEPDAEDVAAEVEAYLDAVEALLKVADHTGNGND